MKKFDLQLFSEAVQGKKIIYLYRVLEEAATNPATLIAFVTENGRTASKDSESTVTKDGNIRTPGAAEVEITSTSILSKGDTMLGKLEQAMYNDKVIEIWEVNLEEPGETNGTFKGRYFQGYLTEFEKTSSSEEAVECSLTFGINGIGVDGDVTVSAAQQEIANYTFRDTESTGA